MRAECLVCCMTSWRLMLEMVERMNEWVSENGLFHCVPLLWVHGLIAPNEWPRLISKNASIICCSYRKAPNGFSKFYWIWRTSIIAPTNSPLHSFSYALFCLVIYSLFYNCLASGERKWFLVRIVRCIGLIMHYFVESHSLFFKVSLLFSNFRRKQSRGVKLVHIQPELDVDYFQSLPKLLFRNKVLGAWARPRRYHFPKLLCKARSIAQLDCQCY